MSSYSDPFSDAAEETMFWDFFELPIFHQLEAIDFQHNPIQENDQQASNKTVASDDDRVSLSLFFKTQCFLESHPKKLFFLTFQKLSKNSEFLLKTGCLNFENIPPGLNPINKSSQF
jgi:hypothetical protein